MITEKRAELIDSLPPLREVIEEHDLRAQKSLGQNFLLDMNITDKIVREAMNRDCDDWSCAHAIEIGPGPGGLTRALLKSPAQSVHAVEFDLRAVQALQDLSAQVAGDLNVLHADALKTNLLDVTASPRFIVANLPYNIATPLLIGWLKQLRADHHAYQCMALMFQKEVAERIVAQPNTKFFGRLAVISQWLCDVQIMYDLPPHAFTPPPKVNSAVVFFKPKVLAVDAPEFDQVETVSAAAFNQRRKMIRSSLKSYMPAIEALDLDPTQRAENLTVSNYLDIANFQ